MKKILSILIIVFLSISLIACSKKAEAEFIGTITEINDNLAIVQVDEGEEITSSGELVAVSLSVNKDVEFNVGDRVEVGYDGLIQESYPLGINTIYVELLENE